MYIMRDARRENLSRKYAHISQAHLNFCRKCALPASKKQKACGAGGGGGVARAPETATQAKKHPPLAAGRSQGRRGKKKYKSARSRSRLLIWMAGIVAYGSFRDQMSVIAVQSQKNIKALTNGPE